ncbi:MAG: hypothetical protein E7172_00140 [Firmicutes bacterium]|nr:hypothetical protein [Bacillota bacterium]
MIESKYIDENDEIDVNSLKELLIRKFKEIDYDKAKEDVIPFIKNVESLDMWSKDFFISITEDLK